ncbi:hypothetical protein [Arachnia propionica]|uniref:Uncharacterized protein n=1 Tax=Arachnia propionica TaxID=1750 RepID=A0A3P1WUF1_9ACTN|nr:hypothetical protein [Arachnia propionica]RRD49518.1 hypothetical protein EII35_07915 [Arachnia propionica]
MIPIDLILRQVYAWFPRPRRDERGLSQSTENAILLAGAVVIATLVVTAITAFVQANLPK